MFSELLTEFLDHHSYHWQHATRRSYQRRLKPFVRFLAELGLDGPGAITLAHVRRFLAQEAARLAPTTMNGTHTAVSCFFRWLRAEGKIPVDIFAEASLKRPRRPRRVPRDLPLRYIERMIRAAEADTSVIGVRDAAMMRLLISTGIRRIELVRLQVNQVDLVDGIAIVTGKSGHERDVFPDPAAIRAIRAWLVVRPETAAPELFVSLHKSSTTTVGSALNANQINVRLDWWRDVAKIPSTISMSPHKWRHTFATNYVMNGGDAFSLSQLLGHADIQTTQIYTIGVARVLRKLAQEYRPKISV